MYRQKILNSNSFSLCFAVDGGYMTFGGYRSDRHVKGQTIQKTSYVDNYEVSVRSIDVILVKKGWKSYSVQEELQIQIGESEIYV